MTVMSAEAPPKTASLISGGKDGLYAAYLARRAGRHIACTLTVEPASDESHLLHEPGTRVAALQSISMGMPHLRATADAASEPAVLAELFERAASEFGARAISHGGIVSRFQRDAFAAAAAEADLDVFAPLWGADQSTHMNNLLRDGFKFVIVSVGSAGLGSEWLGRTITEGDAARLARLADEHSFNPAFEGGEAETLVLDCPMFSRRIEILGGAEWDGCRGRFEISGARLVPRA